MRKDTWSISEISKIAVVPSRTLQFWTANGVLQPEEHSLHAGSGRHRQYAESEVLISGLLANLKPYRLSIGVLKEISDYFRRIVTAGQRHGIETVAQANKILGNGRTDKVLGRPLIEDYREDDPNGTPPISSKIKPSSRKLRNPKIPYISCEKEVGRLLTWTYIAATHVGKAHSRMILAVKDGGRLDLDCDLLTPEEYMSITGARGPEDSAFFEHAYHACYLSIDFYRTSELMFEFRRSK